MIRNGWIFALGLLFVLIVWGIPALVANNCGAC